MGYQLERAFDALHSFLASTIRSAGPWGIPIVLVVAAMIGLANHDRLMSGFGVFLVFVTAGVVTLVIAFQQGRI
jgi:hypothetical protein